MKESRMQPPSLPFVGREPELRQLTQTLRATIGERAAKFVLIQGDYGIGKTALVEHFLTQTVTLNPMFLVGRTRCTMETELSGLLPFRQLLADLVEQGGRNRIITGNMNEFIKEVAPAWMDVLIGGAGTAIVKTVEQSSRLLGRNVFSQESVFIQFGNALTRLAEQRLIILFIDDLQWADSSSLALLFHLARNLKTCAVLFICAYRPVEAMETGTNVEIFRDVRANLIRYGALELIVEQGIDVTEYVRQRYPLNSFRESLITQVYELTGGHPLFVSQLFSMWEDRDVLASVPDPNNQRVWYVAHTTEKELCIPQTLSEVLDERIRMMENELRTILTCASVEGEDFAVQVIARLGELDEYIAYDKVEALENRYHLVQEQEPKETETVVLDFYRFAHRFFREHIYSQISSGKRRVLHQRVGECLEALYGNNQSQVASQLALHFAEARIWHKAARYALIAAQYEQSRYAWSESEKWCEYGLSWAEHLPTGIELSCLQIDLLECSAYGYYISGKYPKAAERYRSVLVLLQRLEGDVKRIASIYECLADIYDHIGHTEEAMDYVRQGRQILAESATPFDVVHLRLESRSAWLQISLGDNEGGIEQIRNALQLAEQLSVTPQLLLAKADALSNMSIALRSLNKYRESLAVMHKAIDIAHEAGYLREEARNLIEVGFSYFLVGQMETAIHHINQGERVARQIGDSDSIAYALASKGFVLPSLGEPQHAITILSEAIAISESIGAEWGMIYVHADIARAYLALSDSDNAYQHASESVAWARKILGEFNLGYALEALGQTEAARKDWEAATQHYHEAIEHYRQDHNRHLAARVQYHLAELWQQQGKQKEAIALLNEALDVFRELELPHEIARAENLMHVGQG